MSTVKQAAETTKFTLALPKEMTEWLDAEAGRMNISRNSVIRIHLSEVMHKSNV